MAFRIIYLKKIILVGDISLKGTFNSDINNNPERFSRIEGLFRQSSHNFANLEMPIKVDKEQKERKKINQFAFKNFSKINYLFRNKESIKQSQ